MHPSIEKKTQVYLACLVCYVILLFLSAACGPSDDTRNNNSIPPSVTDAYPIPSTSSAPGDYPALATPPSFDPYPDTQTGTLLALDKPLQAGQTVITGVGPPELNIIISNITFLGEQLGRTRIGEDGFFSVDVSPLPAGVRIGLTAEVDTSGFSEADIQPGDGAINVPRVGYFYDSFVVPQQN